jgi:hypothetical protein
VASPEQSFFLNDLSAELPEGCSRIYFGAEFCFWRMPPVEQILSAINLAREKSLAFTLVTPVLGEDERQRLANVFADVLPALSSGDEVLISDWGALELVREIRNDLEVILGRTLSGQKRGPRILDLELTPEQVDYFRKGSWHNLETVTMLQEQGISRVELDNLLQGLEPLPKELKSSLHVPYAMVTSSRNCPFRAAGEFGPCNAPCGEVFTLQTDEVETLLFQDGNTQFLLNETIPEALEELGIDRIVVHPRF